MWRVSLCCLFVVFISVTMSYEIENFNDRGWRPLTNQEVFFGEIPIVKQINKNMLHIVDNSWDPTEILSENVNYLANDAIKLVKPQQIFEQFKKNMENSIHTNEHNVKSSNELLRIANIRMKKTDFPNYSTEFKGNSVETDSYKNDETSKVISERNIRQPKKILDPDFKLHNVINELVQTQKQGNSQQETDVKQEILSNEESQENIVKTYEVTENSGIVDAEQTVKVNTGYVYQPPDKNNQEHVISNFTNVFLNILAKYKINTKDELSNYAQSRVSKVKDNFEPEFIYVQVPLRANGYNSLNHLPVNPLLAVLLSNYGYYLPGSYGLQNSYKNLYGYLASNNIHNNKPFGLYKLFSDTDSSNK